MGFGNPVRGDDAVGVYVIEQLKKRNNQNNHTTLLDMGTAGFEVLFGLEGHKKIMMIDAVLHSEEPPGTLFHLPAEEVLAAPEKDPLVFLHGIKWNQALSYAKKILGKNYPEDIQVYLIAIADTKFEMEMSEAVQKAGDALVKRIEADLQIPYT